MSAGLLDLCSCTSASTSDLCLQEDVMMSEIYHRGPIVCSISTPEDFTYGYRGGIYNDPLNYTKDSIDHNVEVRAAHDCLC